MIRTFQFFGEPEILFDDEKTVKELIKYAFDEFGYYEPFGIDTVTIYQSRIYHFTSDTTKKCSEEIKDPNDICFAYHIPNFLYYAEGGWGHHMIELGNHPKFQQPVSLKLKFEDFKHTVVFEGSHSFREVLNLLEDVGYIDDEISKVEVRVLADFKPNYSKYIYRHDPILDLPMIDFERTLPIDGIVTLVLE